MFLNAVDVQGDLCKAGQRGSNTSKLLSNILHLFQVHTYKAVNQMFTFKLGCVNKKNESCKTSKVIPMLIFCRI